ncbi:MAG: LysM peptidoglycan-binding domain-containing protein [Coprobacillaceae bacterium]
MYNDYMDNLFNRESGQDMERQMVKPMPSPQPSTEVGKIYIYDVRRGDNLHAIARRFNTSAEMIRNMNDLGPNSALHPGQKILIPVLYKKPQPKPQPQPMPYPMPQPRMDFQPHSDARQSYDLYF